MEVVVRMGGDSIGVQVVVGMGVGSIGGGGCGGNGRW